MDCFQPIPPKDVSEAIFEAVAKNFGIESDKEKYDLHLLLDVYADIKGKEGLIDVLGKAFPR